MWVAKKLALIGAGYGLSVVGGIAAVTVNEMLIAEDIKQTSGGMVAFGDMIVFVLAAGVLSLAPTWFLLKLCVEKIPRTLLAAELLIAAIGPVSWLTVRYTATVASVNNLPHALIGMFTVNVAFAAIPRIVLGPVLVMIEVATFFMVRERLARTFLAAAMLMDIVPIRLFALHMITAIH